MTSKPHHQNRLKDEKSPYLLQHATNPVDWFPWGEEAFSKAIEEDKPIFLSIGYATCHWCHVMEKESFEKPHVANLMNDTFVNIKVDREELPEIDNLYMEFAQSMMAGSSGWPLNVILTPELEPFFAATYLPPIGRSGMMGLTELIYKIHEVWNSSERSKIMSQARTVVNVFEDNIHTQGDELPSIEQVSHLSEILYKLSDPIWGGLKGSPKFPIGYQPLFLLRHFLASKDARSLFLAEKFLDMMSRGGIYDHLGGGFSRYSVDEEWFQPHFEKMLYDNALLIEAFVEAYLITKKPLFRKIAEETADYILSEMTSPEGGFYSAEDADSEGEEGLFYTWKKAEIVKALGQAKADIFCDYYDISDEGNFHGRNILYIDLREQEFSDKYEIEKPLLDEVLHEGKKALKALRDKRVRPFKDTKILTSWNGLMIHSMAKAGSALGEAVYLKSAVRAAQFIKDHLWREGVLYRRYCDHEVKYEAGLDDYAFLIRALITLFEKGEGTKWLSWAIELNEILKSNFKEEDGAYFYARADDPHLILRKCLYSDGAEPSGNAIQCENLLRLWQLTFDETYYKDAEDILKASKKYMDNYPPGYAYHMMNLSRFMKRDIPTLIIALNEKGDLEESIRTQLCFKYIPLKAVVFKKESDELLSKLIPNFVSYRPIGGKSTLWICRHGVCEQPLTEEVDIQEAILKLAQTV